MIAQEQKPIEEILEYLDGKEKIVLVGCGGSQDGKCEVDLERDCAWVLIYGRLKEFGELDRFRKAKPKFKDYSKKGAEKTLRENKVKIFCEIHHGFLEQLGQSTQDIYCPIP
ncbi:MAG: methylenetetrahydrofolate reductase C-terminal domain-containing protein [Deltaproteobacteria bacterium]|nr:methylenetetrahydrofolate reductase C-terminal domain-containing protein [Deltaproteobacteria bacterium]